MNPIQQRLASLTPDRLRGMRRGVEKESLRVNPGNGLALTPHPAALGSALPTLALTLVLGRLTRG